MSDSDLSGLIERVKGASGPDREIDLAIACAFASVVAPDGAGFRPEMYTGSLDAALSLVSAKLPGWQMLLCVETDGIHLNLYRVGRVAGVKPDGFVFRDDRNIALALIGALLLALQPQGQPDV